MTTTVLVEAHCNKDTIVEIILCNRDGLVSNIVLKDGDRYQSYVYDDRQITSIREVPASTYGTESR